MSTVEDKITGRTAEQVLAATRDVVDPAVRAAIDRLPASARRITGYHFGWRDQNGRPTHCRGGKAFRPALVMLTAQAGGSDPTVPLPAAVAVELVHNFSLLHDDVLDDSDTRHHRPTAWSVFGVNAAILAGDSLLALAFGVLAASQHPAAQEAVHILSAAVHDLVDGQFADLDFERRTDVTLAECLAMAKGKSAALIASACALGALFGGTTPETVARLRGFGEQLGLAFQLVDDLLGIWGDPKVTGKPIYSDLRNRKKSLPVVAALTSNTPAGHELAGLYHRPTPLTTADLAHAAALIDTAGGRTWSQTEADRLLASALYELGQAAPVEPVATELGALARLATHRDY
jgi:geranylgeranyl diphosphate synthase type I